jgi:hypothetical protein
MNEVHPDGSRVMSKKAALIWVLPNILGIIAFLYLSSWSWLEPGAPAGGPGDPIVWMLTAFPILAACSILNVIWIIRIVVKRDRHWKSAVVWLLFVLAWYSAYRYDVYRFVPNNGAEQAVAPVSN